MARTFTLNGRITRRSLKRAYSMTMCARGCQSTSRVRQSSSPTRKRVGTFCDKYLGTSRAMGSEHRVPPQRARHSSSLARRHRTATAAAPRSIYFVCVCVCLTVCDHAVWRRASNVARARTREHGADGADRIGAMRARRRGGYRRWRRLRRARRRRDVA